MSFREEVDALHTRFLDGFKTRDAVAGTAGYTEDAVYLASGSEPVRGRTAIATGFSEPLGVRLRREGHYDFERGG
jgi:ketosteroid isomerase-like protein